MPSVEHIPNKYANAELPTRKLSVIWNEKRVTNGPSILYGEKQYALAPIQNYTGVCAPSILARKYGIKLFCIWDLQKLFYDTIGQWVEALFKKLKCCQLNPLNAIH